MSRYGQSQAFTGAQDIGLASFAGGDLNAALRLLNASDFYLAAGENFKLRLPYGVTALQLDGPDMRWLNNVLICPGAAANIISYMTTSVQSVVGAGPWTVKLRVAAGQLWQDFKVGAIVGLDSAAQGTGPAAPTGWRLLNGAFRITAVETEANWNAGSRDVTITVNATANAGLDPQPGNTCNLQRFNSTVIVKGPLGGFDFPQLNGCWRIAAGVALDFQYGDPGNGDCGFIMQTGSLLRFESEVAPWDGGTGGGLHGYIGFLDVRGTLMAKSCYIGGFPPMVTGYAALQGAKIGNDRGFGNLSLANSGGVIDLAAATLSGSFVGVQASGTGRVNAGGTIILNVATGNQIASGGVIDATAQTFTSSVGGAMQFSTPANALTAAGYITG